MNRKTNNRYYADFKQAAALLHDDNLVWSKDLEDIRKPLANLISKNAEKGVKNDIDLIEIVQAIIFHENDLSI